LKAEITIPPELVSAIVEDVVARLRPMIATRKEEVSDAILTPEQLAQSLQVTKQWIYERVSLGEIPHTKVGRYLRFRKSVIDKWIDSISLPSSNHLSKPLKAMK
jgi:excisionase family DNA binding protein